MWEEKKEYEQKEDSVNHSWIDLFIFNLKYKLNGLDYDIIQLVLISMQKMLFSFTFKINFLTLN